MLKVVERLPISAINVVLESAFFLGALIAAGMGNWRGAAYLGSIGIAGLAFVLYARRSGSRDVTRLNALEWRDERDRTLARSGLAAVGAVALLMVAAQMIVAFLTDAGPESPFLKMTVVQVLILNLVWGIANSVAVRRG